MLIYCRSHSYHWIAFESTNGLRGYEYHFICTIMESREDYKFLFTYMNQSIQALLDTVESIARKVYLPFARFSLFIIYFWFGILKIFTVSPANDVVRATLEATMPFIPFDTFVVFLGIIEMGIGLLFLIPGWERIALLIILPHMATTFFPLILLPNLAWDGPFIPSLEGQYIIKNCALIATALALFVNTRRESKI